MYDRAVRLTVTNGWIVHLHGLPWYQQPLPRRCHHCTPTTIARLGVVVPDKYQRCACGALRIWFFGATDWTEWVGRNARRRGEAHSLTLY